MKNHIVLHTMRRLSLFLFVIAVTLFSSCSDDPQSTNEEEVVTTIIVTLSSSENEEEAHIVTLSWDDVNLDAIVDASEITASGPLMIDSTYQASIQILNKSADPQIDITEEIEEEADDHLFCFTVSAVNVTISYGDEDSHNRPLGLLSTWTTGEASNGTINITLRHQPGVKTGDCPGAGDTDIDITFPVVIEVQDE